MQRQLLSAILITVVFTVLVGIVYPLLMTGVSELAFPRQSRGSLITRGGTAVG
jgi:K+-transporting ATPase ATPase C chain